MTTGGAWGKAAISQGLTEHGPEIAVGPVHDLEARWPMNSIKNWLRPDRYPGLGCSKPCLQNHKTIATPDPSGKSRLDRYYSCSRCYAGRRSMFVWFML
jgi:hypothetical protein